MNNKINQLDLADTRLEQKLIKVRVEKRQKINKTESWLFEKTRKIDNSPLTKKKKGNINKHLTEIKRIVRESYVPLRANKLENSHEIDRFRMEINQAPA